MKELISITGQEFSGEKVNSVDARQLYEFLGSKQLFANWIKTKVVNSLFFQVNHDYILLYDPVKQKGSGGHNRKDYALTVDTAKKVSMMENTEAGDKARNYFLECEKVAKGNPQSAIEGSEKRELFEIELVGMEHVARMMKYSSSSLLAGIHKVYKGNNVSTLALPQYTEGDRLWKPATPLLKENNCNMSAAKFNQILIKAGYIYLRERDGANGKIVKDKVLADKGLEFGKNDYFQGHHNKIQIHYYEDSFMDLYRIVVP